MDPLPETHEDPARSAPLRAGRLVRLPDGESHLILSAPVTMGREPASTIMVEGEDVSRSHAYVLRTPQGYLLVDSSLHGTYVNGERVQAQRVLADGDVVELGGRAFRFELDHRDAEPAGDARAPGELPMTSQYRRKRPGGAWSTGKVGLVAAIEEHVAPGFRVKAWIKRYGLSELAGIVVAFCGSWLLTGATGNALAAAYGASVGEAIGFYGSLVAREMIQEAYAAGARRAPYGLRQMAGTWRGLFLEFGPAELLDTGVIRPLAMGLATKLFGLGFGVVTGKLMADLTFYLPVIYTYERRRRRAVKDR